MDTLGWVLLTVGVFGSLAPLLYYCCKKGCREKDIPLIPFTVQDEDTYDETDGWHPRKPKILDLHGYTVNEAMIALKVDIMEVGRSNNPYLRVITGKGIHSKDGIPKIRPAVTKYLDKNRIPYKWQPGNDGMLTLKATPNNRRMGP